MSPFGPRLDARKRTWRRTVLPKRRGATGDQNRFILVLACSFANRDLEADTPELHTVGCKVVRSVHTESGSVEAEWDSTGFIVGDAGRQLWRGQTRM